MTRALSSRAISAVRSVLESTIRISASGTAWRMSPITFETAAISLRVINATVRLLLFRATAIALFSPSACGHDDDRRVDIVPSRRWTTGRAPSQNPRPREINLEPQFGEPFCLHGASQTHGVVGQEHQEAAAAGADELTAHGAVAAPPLVTVVDARTGDEFRSHSLPLPVLVEQPAIVAKLACFQDGPAFMADLLDRMQVADHLSALVPGPVILVLEDLGRLPDDACREQQDAQLEFAETVIGEIQGSHHHSAVGPEFVGVDPPAGRHVLVLLPHRFAEHVDLDGTSRLGQLLGRHGLVSEPVECFEKGGRETAR